MKSIIYRNVWMLNILLVAVWNPSLGQIQPMPINYSVSLVKDINPGSDGSYEDAKGIAIGNTLYFPALDDVWKTTGTEASTVRVKDLSPNAGSNPSQLTNLNGTLFFVATGLSGREIYKSDGTAGGTTLVKDINPGGSSYPWAVSVCNNILLFFADNGIDGNELWRTDGTSAGTRMVKNINKDEGSLGEHFIGRMAILNNIAYFIANDGLTGDELWRTDGTEAGTYLVKDINPTGSIGTYEVVVMNNMLYFLANDGTHGTELWRSDGTATGTSLVKDLEQDGGVVVGPTPLVVVNNILFVALFVNGDGELYKSDGTAAGTVRVKNINTSGMSRPENLTRVDNQVFFVAYEPVHGKELWKSDGTSSGTVLVKDLTLNGDSFLDELTEANGRLFFTLGIDEPHVSNGTAEGTKRVGNINPSGYALARTYMALGTNVFFFAATPTFGRELYKASPCNICPVPAGFSASAPAPESARETNVKVLGNPVTESLVVEISANSGGPITVELLTRNGTVLEKRQMQPADLPRRLILDVKKQPAGLLLLRVRTHNGTRLIKIAKVD